MEIDNQLILDCMNPTNRKWAVNAEWHGHLANVPGMFRGRPHNWDRVYYLTKRKRVRAEPTVITGKWVFVSWKKGKPKSDKRGPGNRPLVVRVGTLEDVKSFGWCELKHLPVA